jgi:hypothetical protein
MHLFESDLSLPVGNTARAAQPVSRFAMISACN